MMLLGEAYRNCPPASGRLRKISAVCALLRHSSSAQRANPLAHPVNGPTVKPPGAIRIHPQDRLHKRLTKGGGYPECGELKRNLKRAKNESRRTLTPGDRAFELSLNGTETITRSSRR